MLPDIVNRLTNTNRCTFESYEITTLCNNNECRCYYEIEFCRTRSPDSCITLNPRFIALCIDNESLERALSDFSVSRANVLNSLRIRSIKSRLASIILKSEFLNCEVEI